MSLTELENAIQTGNLQALGSLLQQNPTLAQSITSHNVSAVTLACYYHKPDVAQVLCQYVEQLSLHEAAALGNLTLVKQYVSNNGQLLTQNSADGFSPLGLASFFGHVEVVDYLLQQGADVNKPSRNGFQVTPLHSAVAANHVAVAQLLLQHGAFVNAKQQLGLTPLHSAAQNGNIDMLILLLEHGADVNIRMDGGKIPAHLAREKGFEEIAQILED
jgi:ankyrin repeat protein